jgi:uncharacterized Tic20 family protein
VHEEQNYGRSREPGDATGGRTGDSFDDTQDPVWSTMSPQDERTWSILAHLSVLVWPITGLVPVAPLIIWLVFKDRSPRVGFHALQSLWYQLAWLVIFIVAGFFGIILTLVTLGLALIVLVPLAFLTPVFGLIPIVHGCYAAYKVNQGIDYRYPFIADRIDGGARRML